MDKDVLASLHFLSAPAWAKREKVCAPAWAEYEKVCAAALMAALRGEEERCPS